MELLLTIGSLIVANAPYLVGVIMPPLTDYLNKDVKSEKGRYFIAILAVIVAAIATEWNALTYGSPEEVLATAGIIFAESQTIYRFYFKDSQLRAGLKNLYIRPTETVDAVG